MPATAGRPDMRTVGSTRNVEVGHVDGQRTPKRTICFGRAVAATRGAAICSAARSRAGRRGNLTRNRTAQQTSANGQTQSCPTVVKAARWALPMQSPWFTPRTNEDRSRFAKEIWSKRRIRYGHAGRKMPPRSNSSEMGWEAACFGPENDQVRVGGEGRNTARCQSCNTANRLIEYPRAAPTKTSEV
jgi:hypothetical protein